MNIFYSSFHAGTTVFKRFLALFLTALLVGCTTVPTVEQAAVFDTASTAVGLAAGGTELNPFGPIGATLFKVVYISGIFGRTPENDLRASALWAGAAANNIVGVVTVSPLLSLIAGVTVGYLIYTFKKPLAE
jgi:hypothetical protein